MDRNIREVLERAFPPELHRTRKGSFGRELTYVEVAHYIRRLNEAFGGDWSFEILDHWILNTEVVVLGKLTAGAVMKTVFGGSAITFTRESSEHLSLSDDLKAAASDALKKACSLLGVGLELYLDTAEVLAPARVENNMDARPPVDPASLLTQRQYRAIMGLAARAGISDGDLERWVQTSYGVPVEELDRRGASEVITKLNQSVNGGNGKAAGGVA